jgi:hypothetical protein
LKRQILWSLSLSGGIAAAGVAFFVGHAWAGGIPAAPGVLTYSGVLEDANGAPYSGTNVEIKLWSAGPTGGTVLCDTGSPVALTQDKRGRFTVSLDGCATAIKANANVWSEVLIDGNSLGRSKMSAVPYAVEASHATAADSATTATTASTANAAGGSLASQVVPAGAVMAFNLDACPSGWAPLPTAAGRAIVGATTGLARGSVVGADQVTLSLAQMPTHAHAMAGNALVDQAPTACPNAGYSDGDMRGLYGGQTVGNGSFVCAQSSTLNAGSSAPFDNRQASIALLYCQKQ